MVEPSRQGEQRPWGGAGLGDSEGVETRAAEQSEQEQQEIRREARERGDHWGFVGLRALLCFQVLLEEMTWGEEIK